VPFKKDSLLLINKKTINEVVYFSTSADLSRRIGQTRKRFSLSTKALRLKPPARSLLSWLDTVQIKSETFIKLAVRSTAIDS